VILRGSICFYRHQEQNIDHFEARTIHLSGGPDFGSDEFLSLMFKNFCIERPKQRRLVPAWDLGIVLKALQLSPFEPLDLISFNFLTYKCCFLLALPSRTLPNRKITPEICRNFEVFGNFWKILNFKISFFYLRILKFYEIF
jgi:hypothetical protein